MRFIQYGWILILIHYCGLKIFTRLFFLVSFLSGPQLTEKSPTGPIKSN